MTKDTGGPAFPAVQKQVGENTFEILTQGGMTLRQYAAIKLRVPDSGIDWLDEMIIKSLRDEFALAATPEFVLGAYQVADTMLEARK
jgi:hypothetical protein